MQTAQADDSFLDRTHIGIWGGFHLNQTKFSNLDGDIFPDPTTVGNGAFGVFAELEFGQKRMFSLRPEIRMLSRQAKIEDIAYVSVTGKGELNYELKGNYCDIRVPIILNIGNPLGIRPYVYVTPVIGFATGGTMKAYDDEVEYSMDASKANLSSVYLAGAVGIGVKFLINIGDSKMHFGVEANYEYGFTDTYSEKEKNGDAVVQLFLPVYNITGSRKFSGFEVKGTLSVPLSIFKKSSDVKPEYHEPVVQCQPTVEVEEKPCYTLDEILDLISLNQRVEGKTICAVDVINFDFGKNTLTNNSREYLDKIAALMIRTNVKIEIRGHTDNVGLEEYNMDLSRKRAEAAYDYLLEKGVQKSKLTYQYFGMSKPIATNDTEEGRTQNRRVEFRIME